MHIVFVIDTSVSMSAPTSSGVSHLDAVRMAVENTVNRYKGKHHFSVVTHEEGYKAIKHWNWAFSNVDVPQFQIHPSTVNYQSEALTTTFFLLNMDRVRHRSSLLGQGRLIFLATPTLIINITDGNLSPGFNPTFPFNKLSYPGSNLYPQIYRWDQRLVSVITRMTQSSTSLDTTSSTPATSKIPTSLRKTCVNTGGALIEVNSPQNLYGCIDNLVRSATPFVVVDIKPLKVPVDIGFSGCIQVLNIPSSPNKTWPIPEPFWSQSVRELPQQPSQPHIYFDPVNSRPSVVQNFPFDKYPLVPSPLTQWILSKGRSDICFYCYVLGSGPPDQPQQSSTTPSLPSSSPSSSPTHELGKPFGYLKPSSDMKFVNLVVLPYNWEELEQLRHQLFKILGNRPDQQWTKSFQTYLRSIPCYYYEPMRLAVGTRWGPSMTQFVPPVTLPPIFATLKLLRQEAKDVSTRELEKLTAVINSSTQSEDSKTKASSIPVLLHKMETSSGVQKESTLSALRDGRMSLQQEKDTNTQPRIGSIDSSTGGVCVDDFIGREALKDTLGDLQSLLARAALGIIATERTDKHRFSQTVAIMQHIDNFATSNTLRDREGTFGSPYRIFRRGSDQKDDISNERIENNINRKGKKPRRGHNPSRQRRSRPMSPISLAQPSPTSFQSDFSDSTPTQQSLSNATTAAVSALSDTPDIPKKAKTQLPTLDEVQTLFKAGINEEKTDEELVDIVSMVAKTEALREGRTRAMVTMYNLARGRKTVATFISQCLTSNNF
eukprot:m.16922 g.16922  ORF g.16922 m.16922 type:complete len:773 (-) comp4689_c0_seq2:121-2439(-)